MNSRASQQNQNLSDEQKLVLFDAATEAPFSGALLYEKRNGVFVCANCGNELFDSTTKFDSASGWPSFDSSLPNSTIVTEDLSHGLRRIEIKCSSCHAHLGHLFPDGPSSTGNRYCVNSLSLGFCPREDKK